MLSEAKRRGSTEAFQKPSRRYRATLPSQGGLSWQSHKKEQNVAVTNRGRPWQTLPPLLSLTAALSQLRRGHTMPRWTYPGHTIKRGMSIEKASVYAAFKPRGHTGHTFLASRWFVVDCWWLFYCKVDTGHTESVIVTFRYLSLSHRSGRSVTAPSSEGALGNHCDILLSLWDSHGRRSQVTAPPRNDSKLPTNN